MASPFSCFLSVFLLNLLLFDKKVGVIHGRDMSLGRDSALKFAALSLDPFKGTGKMRPRNA
jgi:hypothetical protein